MLPHLDGSVPVTRAAGRSRWPLRTASRWLAAHRSRGLAGLNTATVLGVHHSARDFAWLPDRQLHVAATLAHADALVDSVGRMVADYSRHGAFALEETRVEAEVHLRVTAIKPLPPAIARTVGDPL